MIKYIYTRVYIMMNSQRSGKASARCKCPRSQREFFF